MNFDALRRRLSRPPQPVTTNPSAAVLILFAGDRLVFEVRASGLRTQPGEICLPGGRMEPGESPVQCALRETQEELGIDSARISLLGETDYLFHRTGQIIYPVAGQISPDVLNHLTLNPSEVAQVFTVPLRWLDDHPPMSYRYRLQAIPEASMPEQMQQWVQGYENYREGVWWDYEGHLIWGLTARLVQLALSLTSEQL